MHGDFLNKLMRKIHAEQCLALHSRAQEQDTRQYPSCFVVTICNVSYRVSYRDNCIKIHIVSWKNVSLKAYLVRDGLMQESAEMAPAKKRMRSILVAQRC